MFKQTAPLVHFTTKEYVRNVSQEVTRIRRNNYHVKIVQSIKEPPQAVQRSAKVSRFMP
jgi:hypothetical protein